MEWILDTADLDAIRAGLDYYPIEGVTTNPSILKAALPMDFIPHLKTIKELCGDRTFHVQLGSLTADEMVSEAENLQNILGKELFLKVPVTREGIKAISRIKAGGGHVTATAIYYPIQGMLAMAAGADYLAPYCNRMQNNDIDFRAAIAELRHLIDRDHYQSKILAASFKNVSQITAAIDAGAHAVTVQPSILDSALSSALVGDAVAAFARDQARVLEGK